MASKLLICQYELSDMEGFSQISFKTLIGETILQRI